MIQVPLTIGMLLLIWFKTDAFYEYVPMAFHKWFKLDEYSLIVNTPGATYIHFTDFLREHWDCFLTRLITCPICLSTWLGIFLIPLDPWFLANAFIGLLFYYVISKIM